MNEDNLETVPEFLVDLERDHMSRLTKQRKGDSLAIDALTEVCKPRNFCLVYGTNPAKQVSLDSKMVQNYLDNIMMKQDKILKHVEFPNVMERMHSDDAAFELVVSN